MRIKPVIGVSCGLQYVPEYNDFFNILPVRYIRSIIAAGAVPVAIPVVEEPVIHEVLELLDAVVIGGGPDIPPDYYGEPNISCDAVVPRPRVDFDMVLVRACRERDLPFLGVCYGHQVTHVAHGASLIQDIPSQVGTLVKHQRQPGEKEWVRHEVRIDPSSRLAGMLGADRGTPISAHHQAVRSMGQGLRAVAWASDGVLEAAEHPDLRFFFTVQWHPELSPDETQTHLLFGALVDAARRETAGPKRFKSLPCFQGSDP